jgi:DNA-binding CsgD family transcriptional regulator
LNERGDCVFVNRRALEVCAADDGIYIRESRLGAHHPDDHSLLCGLIERANAVATGQSTKPCGTALVRRRCTPPLQVSAVALSPQAPLLELSGAKIATVAVFIRAPDDGVSTLPELLIASYGLTSAEARLGVLLFDGCSLTQAAERNNVSRETVRVQLRSIFSKTHVRRQSDFLRLCWQLVRAP